MRIVQIRVNGNDWRIEHRIEVKLECHEKVTALIQKNRPAFNAHEDGEKSFF